MALTPYTGGYQLGRYLTSTYGPAVTRYAAKKITMAARGYLRRKRYKRRSSYTSTRPFKRRRKTTLRRDVDRLERPFKKSQDDVNANGMTPLTPKHLQLAASIERGVNVDERIGMAVCLRGYYVKGFFQNLNTDRGSAGYLRMALVKSRNLPGTETSTGVYANLFRHENTGTPRAYNLTSADRFQVMDTFNKANIKVLWTKKRRILANTNEANGRNVFYFTKLFKMKQIFRWLVETGGSGSGSGAQITPQIWFLYWWQNDTNDPNANLQNQVTATNYFCRN